MRAWCPPSRKPFKQPLEQLFGRLAPVLLVLLSTSAGADEGRYQDYPVGARALGLGGAFTAIADDSSGIFYNPAGIVDVGRARLSISTSLYGLELLGVDPVEGATSRLQSGISAADLIIVPSATGAVVGVGPQLPGGYHRHAFAFGTQVPQYTSRYLENSARDVTRFSSRLIDRALHAGAAYAFRAGPWLRVGVAGHYVLRTIDAEETLRSPADGSGFNDFQLVESRLRATHHSVRLAAGVKLRPGPRWSIGASVFTPSLGLWRNVDFEAVSIDGREDEPVLRRSWREVDGVDLTSQIPGSGRVGVAFTQPADFTVSVDLVGYLPNSYSILEASEVFGDQAGLASIPIPLRAERGPLVNLNAGVEKLLTSNTSLSLGFFTNLSAAPEHELEDGDLTAASTRLSNVQMVGGALALGFFQKHSMHRLGVTGSTGFGRVVRLSPDEELRGPPPLVPEDATQTFVYVFWSSSFRYGEDRLRRGFSL